jgi:adenylate cyclase
LQEISEAEGGAISGDAHNSVGGRIDAEFADDGDQELKNIARPVRVWRWPPDQQTPAETVVAGPDEPLPLPDKPSIAVLPFDNMPGDPEQEFFADGIAEDVITTLSKIPALLVIARNSSFHYKANRAMLAASWGYDMSLKAVCERPATGSA